MQYSTTIPAHDNPISLVEAKLHLRVDHATDDELIKALISSATSWCEAYEGRAYMVRTSQIKLDAFCDLMKLKLPPIQSISSITYIDTDGTTQTLSSSVYSLYNSGNYGHVTLAYNQTWPSTRDVEEAVTITYINGFATTFTAADTDIVTLKNAIFAEGDLVRIQSDANDLPVPLSANTDYYVRTVSGSTIKLATTNSDATIVNLTDAGTGTHYIAKASTGLVPDAVKAAIKLMVAHFYELRQPEITNANISKIEFGVKNLLFERCF